MISSECSLNKACVKQKCVDPCIGACGNNAQCRVYHHSPYCTCLPGFEGDAFIICSKEKVLPPQIKSPCDPNPCGAFASCREAAGSAICSCKEGYFGAPPRCAPECAINEDCPNDKACVRERCVDPCLGSCGSNTECRAMNHLAICTCLRGYRGNSFVGCYQFDGTYIIYFYYFNIRNFRRMTPSLIFFNSIKIGTQIQNTYLYDIKHNHNT